MRRLNHKPERPTVGLIAIVLAVCMTGTAGGEQADAPFDRELHDRELSLRSWHDPEELAEGWSGARIVLRGVYLSAEGFWKNEIYAGSCRVAGDARSETHCPKVFLGRLPPEEAAAHLERIGEGTVDVYLTVGQIVPRPFPRQFGMLEALDGAWVGDGESWFHVEPEARSFAVPEESGPEVAAESPEVEPEAVPLVERLAFKYRTSGAVDFFPLDRTALLAGAAEILVESPDPENLTIERVVVHGPGRLCESPPDAGSCAVEFGGGIAGRRFTVEVSVRAADGGRESVTREFVTLDAQPSPVGPIERYPPDEITRLVRVEIPAEDPPGFEYRIDLPPEVFSLKVSGIAGARITAVTRPHDEAPVLIPIFLNVTPYFLEREPDAAALEWADSFTARESGIVPALRAGLRRAARGGVDAEYIVVDYAISARFFGPFRLIPGERLTAEQKDHNNRTLEGLVGHLRQPPLPEWRARIDGEWISDIESALHTLDLLYFRSFPGLVGALLISDGSNNPAALGPIFQSVLWAERVEQVNEILTPERVESVLAALDRGRSLHDDAITGYLATVDERSRDVAMGLAALIRNLGPRSADADRPYRVDRSLQMDALVVPAPKALRSDAQREFNHLVRDRFGGEIYRIYQVRKTAEEQLKEVLRDPSKLDETKNVGEMIRRVHDQLRGSYLVTAEIPNDDPDGSQHELTFKIQESRRTGKGKVKYRPIEGRVRYLSRYTSSKTMRDQLPDLATSPFSLIRLLAAHEIRNHWDAESLADLLQARMAAERDRMVLEVLFESAVVRNLKRLQVTPREVPDPDDRREMIGAAFAWLQRWSGKADESPVPRLAREAGRLSRLFRHENPDRFDGS